MIKKRLYAMPCYKIMIAMGVVDVLNLCSNALLAGYYSIIGRNYCENDKVMPIIGAVALGMWGAYCAFCILLACNRSIDLCSSQLSAKLFDGKRLFLWFLFPILYGAFFASPLQPKVGYSADFGVWFIMGNSIVHSINNFLTCTLLFTIYIWLIYLLWKNTRTNSSHGVSNLQKQVIVQCFFICSLTMAACISYIVIQVASVPPEFYKLSQFSWQACHGGNAIIYLTLNRTIRKTVGRFFRSYRIPSVTVSDVPQVPQLQNYLHRP
uniref:7TM GPCR serpentine receptor class x (Srx) domain-containing protein n=1 Tax=Plectus sambesii TaxID=2011161 RepID=A0A914WEB9_9BILA